MLRKPVVERTICHLSASQCEIPNRLRRHRWPVRTSLEGILATRLCLSNFARHHFRFGLGDIALDDIAVFQSCPKDERLCTFEDPSICNYVNDVSMQYNWILSSGDASSSMTLKPPQDHTDGTGNGGYMMVDISNASSTISNRRARLISPVIIPNGEQCVEYWYYGNADALSSASKLSLLVRSAAQSNSTPGSLLYSQRIRQVSSSHRNSSRSSFSRY